MSFRKRQVRLPDTPSGSTTGAIRGTKPSAIDARPVTSTGTRSLDALLAGHGGLALGTSLIVEENGTTDYAGALMKYFAAEGISQGHHIHVLGNSEAWTRSLPGVVEEPDTGEIHDMSEQSRMKIAWRYESLGKSRPAGTAGSRGASNGVGQLYRYYCSPVTNDWLLANATHSVT